MALAATLPVLLAQQLPCLAEPAVPGEQARPKVCLVLSGGGARGAAHVGVLKVLEELRVPIDCIAGTSMGAIVGAAYASGTSVDEMETILASMSSRHLFKELPPRAERAVRLKRDDPTNLAALEVGLEGGRVLLPKGLVSGVQLETVLRRLSKVQGIQRFDELPIPFRCVATDLETGEAVVLRGGDLVRAMRASMSVPAFFEPVKMEGRLLVDGGLTDNLPVEVARSMGADVVIAVNLGTPLLKPEALTSVLGVTAQMVNILTEQNVRASLARLQVGDVLILPQLGDFSASDFDHLPAAVPVGEAAARAVADRLVRLAVPASDYAAWRTHRMSNTTTALTSVDEIRFAKLQRVNPDIARSVMRSTPHAPIEPHELDRDMRRLFGTGDFEHVSYQLMEEPGRQILSVDAVEKSWGPNYLRLGLGLSSDFRGDAFFNLHASYRMTWLNRLGGEWRSDLQFGRTNRIATEFYQPLEASQTFFVAPRAEYERHAMDVFRADQRIARYDLRSARVGLELGVQFTRYGEVRLGLVHADVRASLDTGPSVLVPGQDSASYTGVTVRALVDQLDGVNFPRSGCAGMLEVVSMHEALGSDANFTRLLTSGTCAASLGEHTLNVGFRWGRRFGSDPLPASSLFAWGGLLQQSGYPTGALLGEELRFGRIVYYRRLARARFLDGIYGGVSIEVGRMGAPLVPGNEQGTLRSAALFFGVDTPVGPLYLGYGRAHRGFDGFYLYLGRP
ncbi:patatin-like phospholipase family protein [Aquabacterium sp. A7-Y]|uniref:patatin-like phospholipase family protein n=1 Tax=Aquabacterium sp. A7-Y TaxID=1349605 RepID=UPI00223C90F3|nr:patatin-like phospholipase family protein [Aquabacterium sp. A7-Y]MCW7538548.1 patatin-like phospholipase family protein [Aquabacterium sp. A7-Y]